MAAFSLNEAWNESVVFVRNNVPMVVTWALLGSLIPGILQSIIIGGAAEQQAMLQQMMVGGDPSTMMAAMGAGVFVVSGLSAVVSTACNFGAWRMALARGSVTAVEASIYAVGAAILTLLVFMAIGIVLVILVALPLGLLGVMGTIGSNGAPNAGGILAAAGIGLLLLLFIFPILLWLWARLSIYGPVMAAVGSVNPLFGMAQSWQRTKASQWAILGYIVLLFIAIIVFSMVLGLIGSVGLLFASGGTGIYEFAGSIFGAVIGAVVGLPVAVAYIAIPVGIYRALNPDPVSDVFS